MTPTATITAELGPQGWEVRRSGVALTRQELEAVLPRSLLPAPGTDTYVFRSMAHDAAFTFERRSAG